MVLQYEPPTIRNCDEIIKVFYQAEIQGQVPEANAASSCMVQENSHVWKKKEYEQNNKNQWSEQSEWRITRRHIPQERNLDNDYHEGLKFTH